MNLCSVSGCKNIARGKTIYCNRHGIQIRRFGKVTDPCFESLQGEVFKDVLGYKGEYKVSNKGRAVSTKRDIPVILKPQRCKRKSGVYVTLCGNETKKLCLAELVATHFMPPSHVENDRLIYVNGDDTDCDVNNLIYESMFLLPNSIVLLTKEAEESEDADKILKFIFGDIEALSSVLQKYRSEMLRAINYTLKAKGITASIISADDIAQEACIKVIQCIRRGKVTTALKIKNWLIAIAKNIIKANLSVYYKVLEETGGYHSDYNVFDLCVQY